MDELPVNVSTYDNIFDRKKKDTRSLSLTINTPESVATVGDLYVTTTLTNTGTRTVKLIDAPYTTLGGLPTSIFKITSERGSPRPIGCKVKFSYDAAIKGRCLTTLAPGETYTSTHHLARLYDFSNVGPGSYPIDYGGHEYCYITSSGKLAKSKISPATSPSYFRLGGDDGPVEVAERE
ncbi:unnamed protein product [Rhizoctonia solani]|uniref:Uncharacterized protein n=1 Tax=Rhizoctonia solani TaxID=456999 RepID=A0A8H3CVM9_9AGAM|nr:unnamed protein product [Rhizoctonia solani]